MCGVDYPPDFERGDMVEQRTNGNGGAGRGSTNGIVASVATSREMPKVAERQYLLTGTIKVTIPENEAGVSFLRCLLSTTGQTTFPILIDEPGKEELIFDGDLTITNLITILTA